MHIYLFAALFAYSVHDIQGHRIPGTHSLWELSATQPSTGECIPSTPGHSERPGSLWVPELVSHAERRQCYSKNYE